MDNTETDRTASTGVVTRAMSDQARAGREPLLDSWDRNNTILVNLLRALPEGGLEITAMEGSPSIAQLFTHIHYERLVFVFEDAPEFARHPPEEEWAVERDPADHVAHLDAQEVSERSVMIRARTQPGVCAAADAHARN